MARRALALALKIAMSGIIAGVVVEGASVAYFAASQGGFFYTRPPAEGAVDGASAPPLVDLLHPYWGYTLRPGVTVFDALNKRFRADERLRRMNDGSELPRWATLRANNMGFFSEHDYPVSTDRFVIAVFGGSVAQWFAIQGAGALETPVEEMVGREVLVLNLAGGGMKQPQQLSILNYLIARGQRIDLVLNIDGFNEAVLTRENHRSGAHVANPRAARLRAFEAVLQRDTGDLEVLLAIKEAKRALAAARTSAARSRLATGWFAATMTTRAASARLEEAVSRVESTKDDSGFVVMIEPSERGARADTDALGLWGRSSRAMAHAAGGIDADYLHVLQPNQYFSKHRFSPAESAIALTEWYGREDAAQLYPALVAALGELGDEGVGVLDATAIFDDAEGTLFSDSCCHYNQRGNDLLAEAIAAALRPVLSRRYTPEPAAPRALQP